MPKLKIDGEEIEVAAGTTVLQACLARQINVPYFCYHPKLSVAGNCRMCLVEVVGRPKLEISCNLPVQEGMEVRTNTQTVLDARKSVLEFILINHPLDCPICDQAGECKLQDQYFDHSAEVYRFHEEKVHKPKAVPLGPLVMLDDERCILCTRCVRFCDEVPKTHEITLAERGDRTKIVTFENEGMKNAYSLNTVDICPVGALTNRDFRFNKRVWFLEKRKSICTGCATGCNIWLDHDQGVTFRYRPRENESVNGSWMCDEGRLSYKFLNAPDRIVTPFVRGVETKTWERATWGDALARVRVALANAKPNERAVVLSAQCTTEENLAWWWLAREGWKGADLAATAREYANASADDLLRHKDKNPNRAALEMLQVNSALQSGAKVVVVLDTLSQAAIAALQAKKPACVIVLATNWESDADAVRWRPLSEAHQIASYGGQAKTLDDMGSATGSHAAQHATAHHGNGQPANLHAQTTQRLMQPPQDTMPWADIILPLAPFAEQSGTFINAKKQIQRFDRAMPAKGEARDAGHIAREIAALEGIALAWNSAHEILAGIGECVPNLRGVTWEKIGETGLQLTV